MHYYLLSVETVMSYELLACVLNCLWFMKGLKGRFYERVYIVEMKRHVSARYYPGDGSVQGFRIGPGRLLVRAQVPKYSRGVLV